MHAHYNCMDWEEISLKSTNKYALRLRDSLKRTAFLFLFFSPFTLCYFGYTVISGRYNLIFVLQSYGIFALMWMCVGTVIWFFGFSLRDS